MSVLLGVILLFAVLSLVVAATQAAAMVRQAPANERLGAFMPLGWWKFRQIEGKAGPGAAERLNIYKRAVIAFLVFLVLGVVLSGWSLNQRPALQSAGITPVSADGFAFVSPFRRVAPMPGAPVLES
jgi:hypothetical protein